MATYSETISFSTKHDYDYVDLESKLNQIVKKSGIQNGICVAFAPHATGIIAITELESRLKKDIQTFLDKLVPSRGWAHGGNGDAHLKSMLLNPCKIVPVINNRIAIGTWQSIFFIEVDGGRSNRRLTVIVIGD
ncbi:MAG: YjbQ family protein [Candidatus Helarchaeota archaeon]|nr:YjbQ family protein [Candidatus Helarchaeota archaeon]